MSSAGAIFNEKRIDYLQIVRIEGNFLFEQKLRDIVVIQYHDEQEKILTEGKINLKDFKEKQKPYLEKKEKRKEEMVKDWKRRYKQYLYLKRIGAIKT